MIFENNQGQSAPVNGNFLGMQLATYDTLRLAIINACEGASSSNNDSYAGVAQNLLQRGNLPAVIAMQFAITDNAAVRFAEVFYDSLAAGSPVDFALSRARVEMIESQEDVEWATPVLFMRSNSGELFDTSLPITHGPSEERPGNRLPPGPLAPFIPGDSGGPARWPARYYSGAGDESIRPPGRPRLEARHDAAEQQRALLLPRARASVPARRAIRSGQHLAAGIRRPQKEYAHQPAGQNLHLRRDNAVAASLFHSRSVCPHRSRKELPGHRRPDVSALGHRDHDL